MTEIRRLTVADLPAALELCNEIREHHRRLLGGYFAPLDYALEEENLKSFIADENKVAFAAAEEGRLAGLLTAAVKHSPWLEIRMSAMSTLWSWEKPFAGGELPAG